MEFKEPNYTQKTFKVGDRIQCETDRDEMFTGVITALLPDLTILYEDDESGIVRKALPSWCEVIYYCDDCQDTGELVYDELDNDSKQYMRGTGVMPCHCRKESTFDEHE